LAGPAAAALNDYGTRAATRLLATRAVIDLVQSATRVAHSEFLRIVDGKPGAGQRVYLQLRPVVLKLASRLGLENQVAARLPANAGRFLVLDDANGTIDTVRQSVKLVRALSLFLLFVVLALYAFAIWLARGWRREASAWPKLSQRRSDPHQELTGPDLERSLTRPPFAFLHSVADW
jgi:hypothetical protein